MTDDIKLPELPEIRLPISKDDWYSHIEMLMHDYAREAVRMNAQVQRPVPTSDRLPFIIDVGFRYENGFHTPTVLLGFSVDDWKARDAFVRDSGLVRPAEVKP